MAANNIKVLVIPTWYPQGGDKLMGVYHKEFCESLAEQPGVKSDMLYVYRQLLSKPTVYMSAKKDNVHEENGYKVYERLELNLAPINFDMQMKSYTKALFKAYEAYEKENGKPDIIHAHVAVPAGYASVKLGEKIGVPVVITEHATYFERFFEGAEGKYCKYALDHAHITCVAAYMTDIYKKHGYKAEVFPNQVNTDIFGKVEREKPDDTVRVISVCAFRDVKRLDLLMKAVKLIRDSGRKIKYTAVGDGEYEQQYRDVRKELGLEDCVEFTGRKNKPEIAELMKNQDVLVLSSDIETFGIPVIEAMASGVPVVSTKCFGPEDIITDNTGILCERGDIEGMAKAIIEIKDHPEKYTSEACRRRADDYSADAVAGKAVRMYHEILKR